MFVTGESYAAIPPTKKAAPLSGESGFLLLIGRGEKIRTSDPHNPIVVRYQAALRPDRVLESPCNGTRLQGGNHTCHARTWKEGILATQNLQNLFKFRTYLLDNLLTLGNVRLGFVTSQALARPADRESFVVQEAPDLTNDQNILTLIVTPVTPAFHGLELRKLLLPISKYVRLNST